MKGDQMDRVIIGAPFGNWRIFRFRDTTPTIGSYTWENRGGIPTQLWRVVKTVRYSPSTQTWVNKLSLPNRGICTLRHADVKDRILNIYGFDAEEWRYLVDFANDLQPEALEFNLSCPNAGHPVYISEVIPAIRRAVDYGINVIVKLPPVRWMLYANYCYHLGVRRFHCCNTIPVPRGGLSGKALIPFVLWAITELRDTWAYDIDITAGGGITCLADVNNYIKRGADRVAIASMLFNPFNWPKISEFTSFLAKHFLENQHG
jgi:dihydroorotate dehydrogenase